jgi:hypothetical protein
MPGYSAECVSGHHESCTDRDCRCMCAAHPHNRKTMSLPSRVEGANPSGLACPLCNRVPRPGDLFCRADGEKLVSPQKCQCGAVGDKADRFCGKCGSAFLKLTPLPEPQFTEQEIQELEKKARLRPSDVEVPPTEVH